MKNELGNYLKEKIKKYASDNNIKKSEIIRKLEITTQYLNDIENGKRVPSATLMKKMIEILEFNEMEKIKLYDLASISHKSKKIPADIEEFILNNKAATKKIRKLISEMDGE